MTIYCVKRAKKKRPEDKKVTFLKQETNLLLKIFLAML